jgi:hypothetical protein
VLSPLFTCEQVTDASQEDGNDGEPPVKIDQAALRYRQSPHRLCFSGILYAAPSHRLLSNLSMQYRRW